MTIAISPQQEYVYPIKNSDGVKISLHMSYGGDKSKSVPCGFITTYVFEKKKTKRQRKNERYHANKTKASNRVSLGAIPPNG